MLCGGWTGGGLRDGILGTFATFETDELLLCSGWTGGGLSDATLATFATGETGETEESLLPGGSGTGMAGAGGAALAAE